MISYRPQLQERPLSCNLNQCELYSCILGYEEESALSIIDPVTINIEVNDRSAYSHIPDISDVALTPQHTVEVFIYFHYISLQIILLCSSSVHKFFSIILILKNDLFKF